MASTVHTTIRYDGPALSDHQMDVQELAPALLALAEIIQAANRKFNGDRAGIQVLVKADVEQRCFQIDLHLAQSLYDQAKTLVGLEQVTTAKEIAEWVGLIGGGGFGLFKLLKAVFARPQEGVRYEVVDNGDTTVALVVIGNEQPLQTFVDVPRPVYELASDPEIAANARKVLQPLQRPGYETLAFLQEDAPVFEIAADEAAAVIAAPLEIFASTENPDLSIIRGWIRIKGAQYEGKAQWQFLWSGRSISVSMADDEWLTKFQNNQVDAPPNTVLDVTMEMKVTLNERGERVGQPSYKILKVHDLRLPPRPMRQPDMFDS